MQEGGSGRVGRVNRSDQRTKQVVRRMELTLELTNEPMRFYSGHRTSEISRARWYENHHVNNVSAPWYPVPSSKSKMMYGLDAGENQNRWYKDEKDRPAK